MPDGPDGPEPAPTLLRGITWDHTRGLLPAVAASLSYRERTAGGVEASWTTRSLWEFGEGGLADAAAEADLLIVDHPLMGDAAASGALLPLDDTLAGAPAEAVGESADSYLHAGRRWALPVDAACQVAAWRGDLLDTAGTAPPTDWDDLAAFARRHTALMAMPMAPIDLFTCWLSLCASLGDRPFRTPEAIVPAATAKEATARLSALVDWCGRHWLDWNPIRVLRTAATTDRIGYIPYTFGYSNHARPGYLPHRLAFGPSPSLERSATVLGGAGVAVSARTAHPQQALALAEYLAAGATQAGPCLEAGGQPAARAAWTSPRAAALAGGYFADTLPALEAAFARPTLPGMTAFQRRCGETLSAALRDGRPLDALPRYFDEAWRHTAAPGPREEH